MSCVVIDENGHVLDKTNAAIHLDNLDSSKGGSEDRVNYILQLIAKTAQDLKSKHPKCASVGIGIPGNVDPTTGSTRYLPNYGWLTPVSIGPYLESELDCTVKMRNDGRCAAIAESKLGIGRNSKVFAMVTLGTGPQL